MHIDVSITENDVTFRQNYMEDGTIETYLLHAKTTQGVINEVCGYLKDYLEHLKSPDGHSLEKDGCVYWDKLIQ